LRYRASSIPRLSERTPTGADRPSLPSNAFGLSEEENASAHETEAAPGGARSHTPRSDEHRFAGATSGEAASKRRAPVRRSNERRGSFEAPSRRLAGDHGSAPSRRLAGGHGQRSTPAQRHGSTPTAPVGRGVGGAIGVGTGNRVSVNGAGPLGRATGSGSSRRQRRSGNRPDRVGGGTVAGQPVVAPAATGRATGNRATTGIARRAFGHDGRCVGRDEG